MTQEIPGLTYVPLLGAKVTDGHSDRKASADARVGQVRLPGLVHGREQLFVRLIDLNGSQRVGRRLPPEAHDAQWNGSQPLKIGMGVHPRSKLLGEVEMPRQMRPYRPDAKRSE